MTVRIVNLNGSVSANSNVLVLVEPSEDLKIGDTIIHGSFISPIYIQSIKSSTRLIASNIFPVTIVSGNFGFGRDEEKSKFNKFLDAYYKFLESNGNAQEVLQNIKSYTDIDTTVDSLLSNFFTNYASNIPQNLITDKRTFIKRVKDLYKTNGTANAHKILFRALYNEEIEIFYPEDFVLKASDGQWIKDYIMHVEKGNGYNPFFLENSKIIGQTSGATATVSRVTQITSNTKIFYELNIDENSIDGQFIADEIIVSNKLVDTSNVITVNAKIIPSLIGIDIINRGIGYTSNNKIIVNSLNGELAIVKIKGLDRSGRLNYIEIIDNGVFYYSNTIVTIDSPLKRIEGTVSIVSSTPNNIATFTSTSLEHGLLNLNTCNVELNSVVNVTAKIYTVVNSQSFRFRTSQAPGNYFANLIYNNTANLLANIGAIKISDGYWKNSRGKLSELIYLRGSKSEINQYPLYYQPYSYVVQTNIPKEEWQDVIRKTVHPAGTEVFGEVFITTESNVSVDTTSVSTEIWNYLAITCDKSTVTVDTVVFGTNFYLTADHSFVIFDYI